MSTAFWPEPARSFEPEPLDGPVLVLTSYRVAESDGKAFRAAMAVLAVWGRWRQRTGASQWHLFRSIEHASTFVEAFAYGSGASTCTSTTRD